MKSDESKWPIADDLINEIKERGMDIMLEVYGDKLPHKEILADLAKSERDKKHVEKVVRSIGNLLESKLDEVLDLDPETKEKGTKRLREILQNLRIDEKRLLLYTALYHDIGKAINRPRHGPEGADVIKDSELGDREKFYKLGFERPDFFLMSDLIRFHDYLAMIQSGETTYLTFVEVLYPVTNIGIVERVDKFLDYLLVMNLADIAGSLEEKVSNEVFYLLMDDYEIVKRAHENISKKVYEDIFMEEPPTDMSKVHKATIHVRQPADIVPKLRAASENNVSERLRRLLRSSVEGVNADKYKNWASKYKDAKEVKEWFTADKQKIDITPVIASLRVLNVGQDFYTKFSFICKLDYAKGFMTKLLQKIIDIETAKPGDRRKSPHDLRRDITMSVIDLVNSLVDMFGDFTLNDTRIGLGFERFNQIRNRPKLLRRLSGEDGSFKRAVAVRKFRESVNMWVVKP